MRDLWLRDGVAFRTVLGEECGGGGSGGRRPQLKPGTCVCHVKLINK